MARLQQTSSEQQFIGWYGTCPDEGGPGSSVENECASFDLISGSFATLQHIHFRDDADGTTTFFKEIYEVDDTSGGFQAYDGKAGQWFSIMNFGVTALQCGRAYYIILKPGSDFLDIDEFQFANQATSSYEYRIADDCAPVTSSCTCSAVVEDTVLKVDFDASELTSGNGDIKGVEIVFDNVVFGEKTGLSGGNAIINDNFKDTNDAATLDFYYDYSIRSTSVNDIATEPNKTKSVIGFIDTTQGGTGATKSELSSFQFSVESSSFTQTGDNPIIADVRVYDSSAEVVQYDITRCGE